MVKKNIKINKYFWGLITGILATTLLLQLIPVLSSKLQKNNISFLGLGRPTPTPDFAKLQKEVISAVLPEKLNLRISFKNSIADMVKYGAIDKDKFLALYEQRQDLLEEAKKSLGQTGNEEIIVTAGNAPLILNLLWPLGIANKTKVLSDGPMGTTYKGEVGDFASTGGWTLGKEDGGKLFNRFPLISLSQEQEALVKELSENIYRPCCGNSTYFPDCNHGAAMLGFLELAVSQGLSKEDIYKKALVLNSYWFPQTYAELAIYFKEKKNTPWEKVDPKQVLGIDYSSGQGYQKINKELQDANLLPQIQGGGGCGV